MGKDQQKLNDLEHSKKCIGKLQGNLLEGQPVLVKIFFLSHSYSKKNMC